jgi:hypothetical protein
MTTPKVSRCFVRPHLSPPIQIPVEVFGGDWLLYVMLKSDVGGFPGAIPRPESYDVQWEL